MIREKTIEKNIKGFIAKQMSIDPAVITRETNLVDDLNADSMDVVNVVTAIEGKYKITFPDDSTIQYTGYTLQFLIDGTMKALENKPTVSRLRRKTLTEK